MGFQMPMEVVDSPTSLALVSSIVLMQQNKQNDGIECPKREITYMVVLLLVQTYVLAHEITSSIYLARQME